MERKVASRKLKRTCAYCNKDFKKGDIYYRKREVYSEYDYDEDKPFVIAYEYLICPKCKYNQDESKKRFEVFKENCHHPLTDDVWSYIPGEFVMQPDHTECLICRKWV